MSKLDNYQHKQTLNYDLPSHQSLLLKQLIAVDRRPLKISIDREMRKQWDGLHPLYLVDMRRVFDEERSHGHFCCRC